jgi:pimeloyl-ACP methyl ester carboxylesterase
MNRSLTDASPDLTLVLIPGLMCDDTVWQPLLDRLDPAPRAVFIANHGEADTLPRMAEQILSATTGPLAVAGHSMGGRVAMELARLAPDRVERLAILGSGHRARPGGEVGEAETAKRMNFVRIAQTEGVGAMARVWVKDMVHPGRLDDEQLIGDIVAMFERKSVGQFAAQIHALLNRPDASDVLSRLQQPVWLICGAQDGWSNVAQHQAMADLLARPELRIVEDAGHMFLMEQPDAFTEVMRAWLAA